MACEPDYSHIVSRIAVRSVRRPHSNLCRIPIKAYRSDKIYKRHGLTYLHCMLQRKIDWLYYLILFWNQGAFIANCRERKSSSIVTVFCRNPLLFSPCILSPDIQKNKTWDYWCNSIHHTKLYSSLLVDIDRSRSMVSSAWLTLFSKRSSSPSFFWTGSFVAVSVRVLWPYR